VRRSSSSFTSLINSVQFFSGPYNALKVDVWSLGPTVWEMAQAKPLFSNVANRWSMTSTLPTRSLLAIIPRIFAIVFSTCINKSGSKHFVRRKFSALIFAMMLTSSVSRLRSSETPVDVPSFFNFYRNVELSRKECNKRRMNHKDRFSMYTLRG